MSPTETGGPSQEEMGLGQKTEKAESPLLKLNTEIMALADTLGEDDAWNLVQQLTNRANEIQFNLKNPDKKGQWTKSR